MNYLGAIALIIFVISLILFTVLTLSDSQMPHYQHYTRAIYDGMTLRDYIVICSNDRVVNILPTNNSITVGSNWNDTRSKDYWCS